MNTRKSSNLVNYTDLSPNGSFPRSGECIRRITPHHMAGNLTVQQCLALPNVSQKNSTSGMSMNYAIDSSGRIGLGLEEINEAWTSSSRVNDGEAITIEIANNGGPPDWSMSNSAIDSFIKLSVDICKFYNYSKVLYEPKSIGKFPVENWIKTWSKISDMIITLHNWFSPTLCPGPYFERELPDIVQSINKKLNSEPEKGDTPKFEPFYSFPYQVKVITTLNCRKKPGVMNDNPPVLTLSKGNTIYTIVGEDVAPGSDGKPTLWGKLKSGAGYICLQYTKRV